MNREQPPRTREREAQLRDGVLSDPEQGWRDFLAHFSPLIHSLIRRFQLAEEDREEVFQEVCLALSKRSSKALRAWDPDKGPLSNYVGVITVRSTQNFLKSRFHQDTLRVCSVSGEKGPTEILLMIETPSRSARSRIHRNQVNEVFLQTVDRMAEAGQITETDWRMLNLRIQGLSYREIAGVLGVRTGSITRGFNRLKPRLKNALWGAGLSATSLAEDD